MKDHRLVRIALFLFIVAISLVYAVFVQVRGDEIRTNIVQLVQRYWLIPQSTTWAVDVISTSWDILTWVVNTWDNELDNDMTIDDDTSFLDEVLWTGVTQILSGTELYYWGIDTLKTLWVRYEYILKDETYDILYAYMWADKTYNITSLVKSVWWKTIEIYARNDIINNLYFGDRVTFVEMPQQPATVTSLFVRLWNELWFIQDLSGQYKKHKKHIRSVFTWK